jgi:hypothetical protein
VQIKFENVIPYSNRILSRLRLILCFFDHRGLNIQLIGRLTLAGRREYRCSESTHTNQKDAPHGSPGRRTCTGNFIQVKWTKMKFESSAGSNQTKQNQSYNGGPILMDATCI